MTRVTPTALLAVAVFFCLLIGCSDEAAGPDDDGTNGGRSSFDLKLNRFGTEFKGVWGLSPTEAIAVGDDGTILHFDIDGVAAMKSGTTNDLNDIWANRADDIFVVGDHDGARDPGVILHYDGTRWEKMDFNLEEDVTGVFGFTSSNVYAVTSAGRVFNYNGSNWSEVYQRPGGRSLAAVWGSGPLNVVAVGEAGGIVRWDGGSWSDDSVIGDDYTAVWGAAYNDIYVCGGEQIMHYDGSWGVTYSNRGIDLTDIHGSGSGSVWAVGRDNVVVNYDGRGWNQSTAGPDNDFHAVWVYSDVDVFAFGDHGSVYEYNGRDWDELNDSDQGIWVDIYGLSDTEVYGVLAGDVWKFAGVEWTRTWNLGNAAALWCAPNNEMWACVFGTPPTHYVYYFDGRAWWPERTIDVQPTDVWGADENSVYVARDDGSVMIRQSGTWSTAQVVIPPNKLNAIWGNSASDVFAVGEDGIVFRYVNGRWSKMSSPVAAALHGVWGSSGNHAIAVGIDGTVIRFNGTEWGEVNSGVTDHLTAVWCDAPDNVWAAGASATVVHFDGTSWRQIESGLPGNVNLETVWGSGGHDVWIGGNNDYLLRVAPK